MRAIALCSVLLLLAAVRPVHSQKTEAIADTTAVRVISPAIIRTLSSALQTTLSDTTVNFLEIVIDDGESAAWHKLGSELLTMLRARPVAAADSSWTRPRIRRPEVRGDNLVLRFDVRTYYNCLRPSDMSMHSTVYEFRAVIRGMNWQEEQTKPVIFGHGRCHNR